MLIVILVLPAPSQAAPAWKAKVAASVLKQAADDPIEFLIFLDQQADLSQAARLTTKAEKGHFVYEQLTALAARTQPPVLEALQELQKANPGQVEYRSFWVANMIWVRASADVLQTLARRADVEQIYANPQVKMDLPTPRLLSERGMESPQAPEGNLFQVQAPQVWAKGFTGQGVVIGGQDTGYDWDHPALKGHYRGWNGTSANHNYSWHDAIHSGSTSCGVNSPVPCDDQTHGTHTMGIMVGDDGAGNQVGMAPGAKWIGCRNMAEGVGSPATYAECFQWFIAPTDLNGNFPRPDLAPDVINNSWRCPSDEGCSLDSLKSAVEAVRAAGIVTVQSAGNSGSQCETVANPAAIYDASFTVGATDENDVVPDFSSRGPVTVDTSGRLKPDIVAPGAWNIKSSVPGTGYALKYGTSMAAPHVAGLVALVLSAQPSLAGDVDAIEDAIRTTAVSLKSTGQTCGGIPDSQTPNNTFGWGRIDALAAVQAVEYNLNIVKSAQPLIYTIGDQVVYTLEVSHNHPTQSAHNVLVRDTLPAGLDFVSATEPHTLNGNTIEWSFTVLEPGQTLYLQVTVQVNPVAGRLLINHEYEAQSDDLPVYPFPPVKIYNRSGVLYLPLLVP